MKITRLESTNVKRLVAVEIEPDGSLVTIGGRNEQGKSSCLDAIMYALGGKGAIPAEPIRAGEKRAKVVLDLDSGLRVERSFTSKGSTLKVTQDGAKQTSPQAILDALYGPISFDPEEYSRMPPNKQAAILRELTGVDTAELDTERADVFQERTHANRTVRDLRSRLQAAPHHADAPDEEVSVAELTDELERRQGVLDANDEKRAQVEVAHENAEDARECVQVAKDAITRLEGELKAAKEHLNERLTYCSEATKKAEAVQAKADALVDPDLNEIREQLRSAEDTNRLVRENQARKQLADQLADAEGQAEKLTHRIEDIDDEKAKQLSEAHFPVDGLGFDEDGVTLDGVPFEQGSQAQRLRVSVAMGLAMNPELKVLLIRNGSALDNDSLAMVAKMAEEADAQVWVEMVTRNAADEEACSVIIEDGAVRQAELEAAE